MKSKVGATIILAYPEEFVAIPKVWYNKPLHYVGLGHDGMIAAGHSAMALVDLEQKKIYYSDFGRYITPFGKGRTRSIWTDPDVEMPFEFQVNNGKITDVERLLETIYQYPEKTQGAGALFASVRYHSHFNEVQNFMKKMALTGSIPYGPFERKGSNCSRYVRDTLLIGMNSNEKRKLNFGNILTPSPLGNVFYAENGGVFKINDDGVTKIKNLGKRFIAKSLFAKPDKKESKENNRNKPTETAQWLGGVGLGSWFDVERILASENYLVSRYKKNGELVFEKEFTLDSGEFDLNKKFKIIHDTHAMICSIIQDEKPIVLKAL